PQLFGADDAILRRRARVHLHVGYLCGHSLLLVQTNPTLSILDVLNGRELRFSRFVGQRIVYLDTGAVADGLEHLVAAGNNFLIRLQAALDLDFGGSGQTGFNLAELGLFVLGDDKDALDIVVLFFRGEGRGGSLVDRFSLALGLSLFQAVLIAHGERLDGDSERVMSGAGGDFGRGGESGTQV